MNDLEALDSKKINNLLKTWTGFMDYEYDSNDKTKIVD